LAHTYAVTDEVGVYRLRSVAKAEDTLVKYWRSCHELEY
jgi:hypothetical protein